MLFLFYSNVLFYMQGGLSVFLFIFLFSFLLKLFINDFPNKQKSLKRISEFYSQLRGSTLPRLCVLTSLTFV